MDEIAFKQNYSNENVWDALINRACAF
jgi:hypothetical protein